MTPVHELHDFRVRRAVSVCASVNLPDCWLVTVPTAVQSLSDDLLKYYQQITRAILGDDPHLMKVDSWWTQADVLCGSTMYYFLHFSRVCVCSGGSAGPPVQLQDRCPPALLCLCHQWGMSALWSYLVDISLSFFSFLPKLESKQTVTVKMSYLFAFRSKMCRNCVLRFYNYYVFSCRYLFITN